MNWSRLRCLESWEATTLSFWTPWIFWKAIVTNCTVLLELAVPQSAKYSTTSYLCWSLLFDVDLRRYTKRTVCFVELRENLRQILGFQVFPPDPARPIYYFHSIASTIWFQDLSILSHPTVGTLHYFISSMTRNTLTIWIITPSSNIRSIRFHLMRFWPV